MPSTAAAEVTMNDTMKEIMFIRGLNEKILNIQEVVTLFEDNSSAITIANETESTEGRFLLTEYYAIKQPIKENEIQVQSVPRTFQIADIMTKAVDGAHSFHSQKDLESGWGSTKFDIHW